MMVTELLAKSQHIIIMHHSLDLKLVPILFFKIILSLVWFVVLTYKPKS